MNVIRYKGMPFLSKSKLEWFNTYKTYLIFFRAPWGRPCFWVSSVAPQLFQILGNFTNHSVRLRYTITELHELQSLCYLVVEFYSRSA